MREHSKNGGFGHEISFVTKRGTSLQVAVFQRLKLQKKCAEMYEGQTKTHLVLAESGISAQSYSLSVHRSAPAIASAATAQQIAQ